MEFRNICEQDYASIIAVIDTWWNGRHMMDMLPRLFFQHFQETSFAVEENHQIVAFLIGFVSQTHREQAYIHFVGVHPDYRQRGLAKELYARFFVTVEERGCIEVHAITAPMNEGSIMFHIKMGFEVERGDTDVNGVPVKTDYGGPGQSRVRFVKKVGKTGTGIE